MHFWFRSTVISLFLFMASLVLIRTQPYDDHAVRDLLLPEGCPAPCFMGIRPGVTGVDDALDRLRSSGWTSDIIRQPNSTWIVVRWNEQAPTWFARDYGSYLALVVRGSLVDEIHVQTRLELSNVELMMGRSTLREVVIFRGMGEGQFLPELNFAMAYPERSMMLAITSACDGGGRITYHSPNVIVRYYADVSRLADLFKQYHDSWRDVLRTHC